jgi:hypothetical protein
MLPGQLAKENSTSLFHFDPGFKENRLRVKSRARNALMRPLWFAQPPVEPRGRDQIARDGETRLSRADPVLVHPGVVFTDPIGALARLQMARAYALAGDKAKARSSHRNLPGRERGGSCTHRDAVSLRVRSSVACTGWKKHEKPHELRLAPDVGLAKDTFHLGLEGVSAYAKLVRNLFARLAIENQASQA